MAPVVVVLGVEAPAVVCNGVTARRQARRHC